MISKQTFQKGEAFEEYVETNLFPASAYDLLERTHNIDQNTHRFVGSTINPDFKFRCKSSGQVFFVEAKYRSSFNFVTQKVPIISSDQFTRFFYLNQEQHAVYIVVGFGGSPNNPTSVSLIPINELKYLEWYKTRLREFSVDKTKSIPPSKLKSKIITGTLPETKNIEEQSQHISSTETISKSKQYRIPIIFVFAAFILAIMAFIIFRNKVSPPTQIDKVKEQISKYYQAIQNNNVEVLDYYLNPILDRWYDRRHVTLKEIKNETAKYYVRYPYQRTDILWDTFQYSLLANGDYNVSYEMNYEVRRASDGELKKFRLKILSIWSQDFKIKSMYEIKL